MTRWLSVFALVGLVCACASPSPPAPTSPPAASPTVSNSSSATAVGPTPAPAVAATVAPPNADVSQARLLEIEGDYANAIAAWQKLLPQPDARYNLALSQALSGDGASALQTLGTGTPDPRDGYARGLALDAQGQHEQAMQTLSEYANANPTVAPAVWLEIAERELNARRTQQAADATTTALNLAQGRPLKQRLLDVRAQALASLGNNDAAFDAYRQILALATSDATLGEQLFHLAQVSRDLGKPDQAIQALKTALDQFPTASTTADALRLLDDLQASDQIDPYVLGRARYYAVDYHNAVSAFDQYLKDDPNGPDASSAQLFRALASLTPGNEPNALRDLDALASDPNQDSDIASQALLNAGEALEGLSEPDQAAAHYQTLLDRFPRLDAAATAGFRLGLLKFVAGDFEGAVAAWDGLIARREDLSSDDVARALYWRGKALSALGRSDEAHDAYSQAAAVTPSNFYSLRAAFVLGNVTADSTDMAKWLGDRGQDLPTAEAFVAADGTLLRAQAEASAGLFREGNWEADELVTRYSDRADRLYALSRDFTDLGLDGGAAQLGQAAYSAASIQTPTQAPIALLQAAYPRPFANLSDADANRYGIDPLLLAATIHDASDFDAWASDQATGASGLVLMSPVHTDEVALALHANPTQQSLPSATIEQQTWLLADRLRRFDGRPDIALSAIATTERLADGWAVRPGATDSDAYIELIDYEGVRSGLRSLFATRFAYALAYGSTADPLAAENVPPEPTAAWIKISRLGGDVPPDAPYSSAPDAGTPDEQAAFARAAQLQRDGDDEGAIAAFTQLASAASSAQVAGAARVRLGQSLIAAGRSADAVAPLQAASEGQPGSVATYLLGRALAEMGRYEQAVDQFTAFGSATTGLLADQALVARANCLADLGRANDAVPLLEQAVADTSVPRLQSLDFRERLALMRLRAGDADGARADYQSLLSIARTASYRSELNYYLGVLAPDPASAATYFRTAVQLSPRDRGAQAALDELVALHDPFALSFEAGDARFAQNRYREALAAYTSFLQQNPSDSRAAQALYGRGASLVRLGQDRNGITVLESIDDQFPNTSDAADGLFRGGRIRESLADFAGAATVYQRVIANPNAGPRADDARFRLAFVQFQQGDLASAISGWRSLSSSVTAADAKAQANFWLGKALHAQGDEAGARSAWTAASTADPSGFYGLRAADWLAGRQDPRADASSSLADVTSHSKDDPFGLMSQWVSSRGGDPAAARARIEADPGLATADTLLAMGLRQPAIWQLGAVESDLSDSNAAVGMLGAWEQQRGLYNTALLLAYDLASGAHVSLTSGPAAVRRLLYPLPNPSALGQATQSLKVDPLLFSALMIQESVLDPSVESSAQARGLSQLISSTAYEAARALGQYGFRTTDLYQPKTSITLGGFVFGERLNRYDQEIFPALAAYNAAEFDVDGWLQSSGDADIDTFAEAIPFTETYPYVQHIYENYKQYLDLYGAS